MGRAAASSARLACRERLVSALVASPTGKDRVRELQRASTGRPRPTRGDASTRSTTRSTAGTSWSGRGGRCAPIAARPASTGSPLPTSSSTGLAGCSTSWPRISGTGDYRPLPARRVLIFEADFQPYSFGYRPRRTAHDALQVLLDESFRGRRWVVETDIADCFEAIPHERLMQAVEERIVDRHLLETSASRLLPCGVRRLPPTRPTSGARPSPDSSSLWLSCDRPAVHS